MRGQSATHDCNSTDPETGLASGLPEAAICVQDIDVQCVLQFTLIHAAGCALHRRTNRVIHRLELSVSFAFENAFSSRSIARRRHRQRSDRLAAIGNRSIVPRVLYSVNRSSWYEKNHPGGRSTDRGRRSHFAAGPTHDLVSPDSLHLALAAKQTTARSDRAYPPRNLLSPTTRLYGASQTGFHRTRYPNVKLSVG